MTVSTTIPSISYSYTGVGDYDYPYTTYKVEDIQVFHTDSEGLTARLVLNTDFTVVLNSGFTGGVVSITNATLTGGTLTIQRILEIEQPVDWVNNDPLDAEILERSFDNTIMMMQQLEVTVREGAITTNWRGDWVGPDQVYAAGDLVTAPNNNWYSCQVANVSSASFDADLAAGYWLLALDVQYIEQLAAAAEASADAAALSETNAATSASSASSSASAASSYASQAATHEANSAVNAQNASNCNQAAFEEAERAQGYAESIDPDTLAKKTLEDTGAVQIVGGTVAERPTPVIGQQRYVTDLETETVMEWWNGIEWTSLGGGGGGGGIVPAEPIETTDFTAEIGLHYPVDTSGGDVVVTPPSTPTAGDWFQLRDAGDTWTNATACYVVGLCHGDAEGLKLNNLNGSFFLQYQDATDGWVLVDGIGESGSAGGDITLIWSGSAGDGVTVDWSGTGYTLSQFDAILLKSQALANGVAQNFTGISTPATMIGSRLNVPLYLNINFNGSANLNTLTETSGVAATSSTGYTGMAIIGIHGIRYGA